MTASECTPDGSLDLRQQNSSLHDSVSGDSFIAEDAPDSHVSSGGIANRTSVTEIGDADLELLEMNIYDSYRQEYGAPSSYKYLLECREKPMTKLHSCRKQVHALQKEKSEAQLQHREELKRIRQFYELSICKIPFRKNCTVSHGYISCCWKNHT